VALDNTLQSKYLTRPVVRQRNSITLVTWSGYQVAVVIPDAPDDAWIRQRIVAEQIPLALDIHVMQTLVYFLQDTVTQTNILQFVSEDNDSATEVALSSQNDSIAATFMPRYAQTVISDSQVTNWRTQNDKPAAAPEQETK
jgi:hypothetical protein